MSSPFTPPRKISIVVPVYGNQETLKETFHLIQQTNCESFPHISIEVVFVDDGSTDDSWEELLHLKSKHPEQVSLVKLSRNFGQVRAILAGYDTATGDAIITISADLQDPVALMAEMVSHWERGDDVVIAHRRKRDDDITATMFSRFAYGMARRANPRIPPGGFDYLLLSRRATDLIRSFKGNHRFFQGDILWLGLPTTFIPYERRRRRHGKSGWTLTKKLKYFTDLMLDSSYLPIQIMSSVGFFTASAGLIYALIITATWYKDGTPFPGWAPIMISILVTGGLIMMMLGTIGEYLWRIYDDVKSKPLYVIEGLLPAKAPAQPYKKEGKS